jgi:hypothetical protein
MTIKLFKIDEVFDDKDLIAGFFSSRERKRNMMSATLMCNEGCRPHTR